MYVGMVVYVLCGISRLIKGHMHWHGDLTNAVYTLHEQKRRQMGAWSRWLAAAKLMHGELAPPSIILVIKKLGGPVHIYDSEA